MSDSMHSEPPLSRASEGRGPVDPTGAVPLPPPPSPSGYYPAPYPPPPPRRGNILGRMLSGLVGTLLFLSIILNVYLGIFVFSRMTGPTEATYQEGDSKQRIVILPITELIHDSTAQFIREALRRLEEDLPAAIVLRVNSPGGTVGASDQIYHLIKKFKEHTDGQVPIVASFGPVAASGGYYVAVGADRIVAEPGCITGSVGVISTSFTVQELMDKIGIKPEILTATGADRKDMASSFRDWTDADRTLIRKILDYHQERFKEIVKTNRGEKLKQEIDAIATGEIFTIDEAKANGLVDLEGYLDKAIDEAKKLANISVEPEVTMMQLARPLGLLGLMGYQSGSEGITGRQIRAWLLELGTPQLEYRWDPALGMVARDG